MATPCPPLPAQTAALIDLGSRAKIMSGLFGVRETVTHVPARLCVQLLDPLVRDANGSRDRRQVEDAGQPVAHYHHADHRESRQFDGILEDGTLVKGADDMDKEDAADDGDDDGWHEEQRRERVPPSDTVLLLNGVDSEGRTVCVSVKGMRYIIYVLCPDSWGAAHMQALASTIEGYYGIGRGGVTFQQKRLHHTLGWEPEPNDLTRTKAHNYCLLGFGSARVMEWAANAIDRKDKLRVRDPLSEKDMRSLQVYERRVDPVHKALERLGGLQPCSWFDVVRWRVPDIYHTHAQIEVEANVRDIVARPEIDIMAPVWKASWDVECYSRDGSFPRPDHPRDCDHTICINTYFSQHRSDGQAPRVIQTSHHFGRVRVHRPADAKRDHIDDPRQCLRWSVLEMDRERHPAPSLPSATDAISSEPMEETEKRRQQQDDERSHHEVYVMQCSTELETIEGWRDLIVLDIQPSVLEGYNTDAFDFDWLGVRAERCARYGVRSRLFEGGVVIGEHTPMRRKDLDSAAKGSNTLNFIPMPGRILIDMYHIVKAEKRLESYTLDDVCRSIFPKDESLRKIDVPPQEIFDHYASGDLDRRAINVEYCARDCRLPLALEEHLMTLTAIVEMARITRTPLPLMLISGQQVKTWSQIVYEAHTMGYVLNAPENRDTAGGGGTRDWLRGAYGVGQHGVGDQWLPGVIAMASIRAGGGNADGHAVKVPGATAGAQADEGYAGATVLQPRAGYYDVPIVTLDYQSLYPSIMEANNLCPSTRVTSKWIHSQLARCCREVQEPASEVRRVDGASDCQATALNRVFASRPDWLPGQFAARTDRPGVQRTVAYREVTPAPSRTHVFVQHVQGVVPRILTALKNRRKAVRNHQKAYEKGSPLWGVYENRQLGIKITANSVYGFLGAVKRGRMPCVEVSESVTCIGRDMINATKAYVETHLSRYVSGLIDDPVLVAAAAERKRAKEQLDLAFASAGLGAVAVTDVALGGSAKPVEDDRSEREKNRDALLDAMTAASIEPSDITGATVVYGDSVGADTPLLLRFDGEYIDYVRADQVAEAVALGDARAGAKLWSAYQGDKEAFCPTRQIQVWTERGWTAVNRVIRHKAGKKMFRVLTHTGCVDVTQDHSLLDPDAEKIKPTEVGIGSALLHADLPAHECAIASLKSHVPLSTQADTNKVHDDDAAADCAIETASSTTTRDVALVTAADKAHAWAMGMFFAEGSCNEYLRGNYTQYCWRIANKDMVLVRMALDGLEGRYPEVTFSINGPYADGMAFVVANGPGKMGLVANYRAAFYDPICALKRVPTEILNANVEIKRAFIRGYFAGDGNKTDCGSRCDGRGKIGMAGIYYLLSACGCLASINTCGGPERDTYRINFCDAATGKRTQRKPRDTIKKIIPLDANAFCGAYVYDLETANHHFAAGIGRLVVHNTDSVMIAFGGVPKTREGVEVALQLGVAASDYITTKFPDQIILDTEKAYWPYVLFRKKRYAGRMWTLEGKPPYIDAKGVEVKRRDNWAGMRKTYKACLEAMMERMDIDAVKDIILRLVCDLKGDRVSLDDYKISKSLKRDYSKCKSPPPHVVVRDKIAKRNPGSEPLAGNRVYFVITIDDRLKKKSARAEDPAYVAANPRLARIDRLYYLDSLRNPFGALLEPCFDNPEQLFTDAAFFIANQQKGQEPITRWLPGAKRPVTTLESPADIEKAEAAERAAIAARVRRRRDGETYVPAAVAKQQKTESRKAARKAPPPKTGPITAFLRKPAPPRT